MRKDIKQNLINNINTVLGTAEGEFDLLGLDLDDELEEKVDALITEHNRLQATALASTGDLVRQRNQLEKDLDKAKIDFNQQKITLNTIISERDALSINNVALRQELEKLKNKDPVSETTDQTGMPTTIYDRCLAPVKAFSEKVRMKPECMVSGEWLKLRVVSGRTSNEYRVSFEVTEFKNNQNCYGFLQRLAAHCVRRNIPNQFGANCLIVQI